MAQLFIGDGTANARLVKQVFLGLNADGSPKEAEQAYDGPYLTHQGPTLAPFKTFSATPSGAIRGSQSNVALAWSSDGLASGVPASYASLELRAAAPDGTTTTKQYASPFPASDTLTAPSMAGRTTYTLIGTNVEGTAHAVATFDLWTPPVITSLTDGGFRTDPRPQGGNIYKHRIDWVLGTASYPSPARENGLQYTATLSVVSGPGRIQSDALRATDPATGRGTLNLTSAGSSPPSGTSEVQLRVQTPGGTVARTVTLAW